MAFLVEDGSGLELANGYVSLAYTDTHHTDRGNTLWDNITDIEKTSTIIRASDYIDKRFGRRFRGERKTKSQGLEWPRHSAFDDDFFLLSGVDDIPRQLEKATAEYALRAALCGVLAPDPLLRFPKQSMEFAAPARTGPTATGEVIRKREHVGPIEDETWYEPVSKLSVSAGARSVQSAILNDYSIPEYPEADMWLEELIVSSMSMTLARA